MNAFTFVKIKKFDGFFLFNFPFVVSCSGKYFFDVER